MGLNDEPSGQTSDPLSPVDDQQAMLDLLLVEELEPAREEKVLTGMQVTSIRSRAVLDSSAEIVHSPERAAALAQRHNELLKGREYIEYALLNAGRFDLLKKMYEQFVAPDIVSKQMCDVQAGIITPRQLYRSLIHTANDEGYFIEEYTPEFMLKRLQSPDFAISEVSIKTGEGMRAVADCQVRLPHTDVTKPIFDMPDPPYDMNDSLLEQMAAEPWRFAVEEDLTCAREFNSKGYAGVARNHAYSHIRNEINPTRGDRKITHAVAAIACMQGIVTPDGEKIKAEPVLNNRSILAHTKSRYESDLSHQLPNRLVPVRMGDETYNLIVRWMMYAQEINHGEH